MSVLNCLLRGSFNPAGAHRRAFLQSYGHAIDQAQGRRRSLLLVSDPLIRCQLKASCRMWVFAARGIREGFERFQGEGVKV